MKPAIGVERELMPQVHHGMHAVLFSRGTDSAGGQRDGNQQNRTKQ